MNVELKARLSNLSAARSIAEHLATDYLGVQMQVDTYFVCPHGRMKLREIAGQSAQLIWYERPDQTDSKDSDYLLADVSPSRSRALKAEMGIRVVVSKRREIFLRHNVRIHLDEVEQLGAFLEFEAVLSGGMSALTGRRQLDELQKQFGVDNADLYAVSYADLLLSEMKTPFWRSQRPEMARMN